jgi:hypothetical protein
MDGTRQLGDIRSSDTTPYDYARLFKSWKTTMDYGAGWIIFEQSYHQNTRKLVSILSARRTARDVSEFMEQIYVDRTGTVQERLSYKKSPKSAPYKVESDRLNNPLYIGHDPTLFGIRAHKILLKGETLEFRYKILSNPQGDPLRAIFEERSQSLQVDD